MKSRNEELKTENEELRTKLEELDRESAELATYITTSIEKSDQLLKKPTAVETKSVGVETRPKVSVSSTSQQILAKTAPSLATGGTQTSRARLHTDTAKHTTQMTTQTSSTTIASVQNTESLWKSRIEACRAEMQTEMSQLQKDLTEQIRVLQSKCDQLGVDLEREQANISKLNLLNKEISFNLSNKNEEYLQLEHAMKDQSDEFKKSKIFC